MPYGPGTYGSKVGRPKKSAAKKPRMKPLTSGQKKLRGLQVTQIRLKVKTSKPYVVGGYVMAHKGKGSCGSKGGKKGGYKK